MGPDFFDNLDPTSITDELRQKINPFDYHTEFPQIFSRKNAGFDIVIGNPPYLYSAGQSYPQYFARTYHLAQYQADFYAYFTEKALSLTRSKGKFSFIVSDSWLKAEGFSKLRNHLLTKHRIESLAVFDYTVFAGATIENSIFVVTVKEKPLPIPIDRFSNPNTCLKTNEIDPADAAKQDIINPMRSLSCDKVIAKIEQNSRPLEDFLRINRGIHAYRTDGYGKSKFGTGPQTKKDKETCSYHANKPLNKTYLPELKGKDIFRFTFSPTGKFLSYGPWLAEPREPNYFFNPKITLRKILGPKLSGTYIEEPVALDQSLYVLISKSKEGDELKYFLGILLSRLAAWYLRTKFAIYDTLYPWYTKKQLAAFPVKEIDTHLIRLVEQMLDLHKKLNDAKIPDENTRIQRQISATDNQIDHLVYNLYGLTEEEITIVEKSSK
ncbi:MAG: Eco57I restriction-modification methylase domain-containing protein [Planctomycetota bacterium]|nr:Eco57I restriction-modification methylase domain-containing protein [Planctomycetota bacterium]